MALTFVAKENNILFIWVLFFSFRIFQILEFCRFCVTDVIPINLSV